MNQFNIRNVLVAGIAGDDAATKRTLNFNFTDQVPGAPLPAGSRACGGFSFLTGSRVRTDRRTQDVHVRD